MSPLSWAGRALSPSSRCPPVTSRARRFESSKLKFLLLVGQYGSALYCFCCAFFHAIFSSFDLSWKFENMSSSKASSSSASSSSSSASRKMRSKSKGKQPRTRPANVRIKTKNASFAVNKTHALSPYLRRVASQMIAPGSSGSKPVLLPSSGASQLCSRHIHKEFDVSQADYPNGFSILVEPDFAVPSYISALDVVAVPNAGPGKLTVHGDCSAEGAVGSVGAWKCRAGTDQAAIIQNTLEDIEGNQWFVLDIETVAGSFGNLTATDHSPNQCVYDILFATQLGAAPLDPVGTVSLSQGALEKIPLVFGGGDRLCWRFSEPGQPSICELAFHFTDAQATSDAARALEPAFARFATEFGVSTGRICSIGCLVTNTSPAIQKGGNINSARIPRNFSLFQDPIGGIASLPDNRRYQSTAETGTYVFWIPEQTDEYEVDDISAKYNQYRRSNRLLVVCTGYPAGATFKVHLDWIIEFYTHNQLFEKSVTPHMTPEMFELFRVIASMPAAMCNPEHENATQKTLETWKQYGSEALDTVKAGVEFIEKYGPLLYQVAEVLAALV